MEDYKNLVILSIVYFGHDLLSYNSVIDVFEIICFDHLHLKNYSWVIKIFEIFILVTFKLKFNENLTYYVKI